MWWGYIPSSLSLTSSCLDPSTEHVWVGSPFHTAPAVWNAASSFSPRPCLPIPPGNPLYFWRSHSHRPPLSSQNRSLSVPPASELVLMWPGEVCYCCWKSSFRLWGLWRGSSLGFIISHYLMRTWRVRHLGTRGLVSVEILAPAP